MESRPIVSSSGARERIPWKDAPPACAPPCSRQGQVIMFRRKLILVGSPGVGKTSLATRFTKGIFSDRYLTTIGVKIEKKTIWINGEEINIQFLDVAGTTE